MSVGMKKYQRCVRCVMDTSAIDICFNSSGECNFCGEFINNTTKKVNKWIHNKNNFIEQVKVDGQGKQYDCIVGLSGGLDSSYALYLAVKNGLKPLAVHLDNGWNSELATHNIHNLVSSLGVDLYTYVIDWKEYRDLQLAFIKANVIDIEMLMDNSMLAVNYKMARKYKIKWILSGSNDATEGIRMPSNWNWLKFDARNIKSIHKKYGETNILTYPSLSIIKFLLYRYIFRIQWVPFLNYFSYIKDDAAKLLETELNFKKYPYKHYESVFTRFYQAYILPQKFGIDKRKLHLSTLIASNQLTRENALALLDQNPYDDLQLLKEDYSFVLKKLGLSADSFEKYIESPGVEHKKFQSDRWLWQNLVWIYKVVKSDT